MIPSRLKLALRVLARRKFFTFVSLAGTAFTLAVLLVATALLDHLAAPTYPEPRLGRTLEVARMEMRGPEAQWSGNPGFRFLDRYLRDLPGVERMSIFSGRRSAVSYPEGVKVISELRATDAEYFRILDYRFRAGSPIDDADLAEARPVAVLTDAARLRLLGAGPALGRSIELDGRRYQVKGVVDNVSQARDLAYSDVWVPYSTLAGSSWRENLMGDFAALLLARDRGDFPAIRAAFAARLEQVEFPDPRQYDRLEGAPRTRVESFMGEMMGSTEPRPSFARFFLLLGAGALLFMLLPAVNLVSMNVSRISERASEIGVRKSFGASSTDLVAQFVIENVVLCLLGGALGLSGAAAMLAAINGSGWIAHAQLALSLRVFACGAALSVVFGVLSGAWPALRMARLHPVEALGGGGR